MTIADTYIEEEAPDVQHGQDPKLVAHTEHPSWILLRFTPPVGKPLRSATLRLYVLVGADQGGDIVLTDNTWTEETKWSDQNVHLRQTIAHIGPVTHHGSGYVDIPLDVAQLPADGIISLAILPTSQIDKDVQYASRDAGADVAPLLIIEP